MARSDDRRLIRYVKIHMGWMMDRYKINGWIRWEMPWKENIEGQKRVNCKQLHNIYYLSYFLANYVSWQMFQCSVICSCPFSQADINMHINGCINCSTCSVEWTTSCFNNSCGAQTQMRYHGQVFLSEPTSNVQSKTVHFVETPAAPDCRPQTWSSSSLPGAPHWPQILSLHNGDGSRENHDLAAEKGPV